MSEQSQIQKISTKATKGGQREHFVDAHNLKVVRLKRRFINPRDYVKRGALESDFSTLLTESVIAIDDATEEILFVYKKLDFDTTEMVSALKRVDYQTSTRSNGLKTTSRVFGYLPRVPMRRDFCTTSSFARDQPSLHATVVKFGQLISSIYEEYTPETYAKHKKVMESSVLDEYEIKDTPFTSGIINKNNPLKYHFDSGNFEGMYSLMLGFKQDVSGGFLSIPDYDVGVEICNNSVFMFDGQEIMHGVTPIKRLSTRSHRFTVVYYSMKQIWNCLPLNEELARIRKIKTEREEKRYHTLLENKTSTKESGA